MERELMSEGADAGLSHGQLELETVVSVRITTVGAIRMYSTSVPSKWFLSLSGIKSYQK